MDDDEFDRGVLSSDSEEDSLYDEPLATSRQEGLATAVEAAADAHCGDDENEAGGEEVGHGVGEYEDDGNAKGGTAAVGFEGDEDLYGGLDAEPALPSGYSLRQQIEAEEREASELDRRIASLQAEIAGHRAEVSDLTRRGYVLLLTAREELKRKQDEALELMQKAGGRAAAGSAQRNRGDGGGAPRPRLEDKRDRGRGREATADRRDAEVARGGSDRDRQGRARSRSPENRRARAGGERAPYSRRDEGRRRSRSRERDRSPARVGNARCGR